MICEQVAYGCSNESAFHCRVFGIGRKLVRFRLHPEYCGSLQLNYRRALTGTLAPTGGWELGQPSGIAVAPNGDVYVADMSNSVIDQFSPNGAYIGVFATSGLFSPGALAFGPDGNLYVSNFTSNGYITRYDSNGNPVDGTPFVPADTGLTYPQGLAFAPNGNLYIGDSTDQLDQVLPSGAFSATSLLQEADLSL